MSRAPSDGTRFVPPKNNIYTILAGVAFVAAAAALTIVMLKAKTLFEQGLFF